MGYNVHQPSEVRQLALFQAGVTEETRLKAIYLDFRTSAISDADSPSLTLFFRGPQPRAITSYPVFCEMLRNLNIFMETFYGWEDCFKALIEQVEHHIYDAFDPRYLVEHVYQVLEFMFQLASAITVDTLFPVQVWREVLYHRVWEIRSHANFPDYLQFCTSTGTPFLPISPPLIAPNAQHGNASVSSISNSSGSSSQQSHGMKVVQFTAKSPPSMTPNSGRPPTPSYRSAQICFEDLKASLGCTGARPCEAGEHCERLHFDQIKPQQFSRHRVLELIAKVLAPPPAGMEELDSKLQGDHRFA